ncbi:MAG: FtsW/RodA/SpoVE family cell cycle protein [Lachnospira eligens]
MVQCLLVYCTYYHPGNIAVLTNTIPNTGVSLPFISYGGTSAVFLFAEMGVVFNISSQIKKDNG